MIRLDVRLVSRLSPAMAALRGEGWAAPVPGPARDEFDPRSLHLVVERQGRPLGTVRITLGDPSVLACWSRKRAPLPHGPGVAELTRGVVAAPVRRIGLYRLAMLETVLRLRRLGASIATAAVEPDFPGRRFLADLGFVDVGGPVRFDDSPRADTLAQPIVLEIDDGRESRWTAMWQRQVDDLLTAGYAVTSEVASPASPAGVA